MSQKIILGGCMVSAACVLTMLVAGVAGWAWFFARPQPAPIVQELYDGITYQREIRQTPRPLVIHVLTVDLRTDGIEFLVTPGDPDRDLPLKARTTSQFLEEFNLQIAINGDGFEPWHSNSILDYYPHPGDPIAPIGLAASDGVVYSPVSEGLPVLYIARTNQARFNTSAGKIFHAISGNQMVVEQGQVVIGAGADNPEPRTAVALDKAGKKLIIVVVDGRQPNFSEGATLSEVGEIILENGGYFGMNLDGGGSTTLVKEGRFGGAEVLNSPIDHRIPGWERPVGNHLGIKVK